GQVYSTLARLERDGCVAQRGEAPGQGPERKLFAITRAGVTELERWIEQAEPAHPYLQNVLFMKVVFALSSGRDAHAVLDVQRDQHLADMRELTRQKSDADFLSTVRADFVLFHLEADLRWIDLIVARLGRIEQEL